MASRITMPRRTRGIDGVLSFTQRRILESTQVSMLRALGILTIPDLGGMVLPRTRDVPATRGLLRTSGPVASPAPISRRGLLANPATLKPLTALGVRS